MVNVITMTLCLMAIFIGGGLFGTSMAAGTATMLAVGLVAGAAVINTVSFYVASR